MPADDESCEATPSIQKGTCILLSLLSAGVARPALDRPAPGSSPIRSMKPSEKRTLGVARLALDRPAPGSSPIRSVKPSEKRTKDVTVLVNRVWYAHSLVLVVYVQMTTNQNMSGCPVTSAHICCCNLDFGNKS